MSSKKNKEQQNHKCIREVPKQVKNSNIEQNKL